MSMEAASSQGKAAGWMFRFGLRNAVCVGCVGWGGLPVAGGEKKDWAYPEADILPLVLKFWLQTSQLKCCASFPTPSLLGLL